MAAEYRVGSPDWRCQLISEVTLHLIESEPGLKLCEGLRLIEAACQAVERMAPDGKDAFHSATVPRLRRALLERFGIDPEPGAGLN